MPLAAAVIGGAALSTIGGLISGNGAAKAQQAATNANIQNTRETNALNKQMFDESRGSTGSAVLPSYLKGYESLLGSDAANAARAAAAYGGGASGRLNSAAGTIGGYLPLIQSGDNYLTRLYNGGLLSDRMGYLSPVNNARTQAARDAASAIDQSIYGEIGRLDADNARRGFFGGSTFDRNRLLMASIGAKLAASQQLAGARLQNAQDTRSLNESDVAMRMQALDQPFSRANSALALQYAPLDAEARASSNAMAPLSFFRLGQQSFQYQRPDAIQPNINSGMTAGSAISSMGGAVGNYFMTNALIKALGNNSQPATIATDF